MNILGNYLTTLLNKLNFPQAVNTGSEINIFLFLQTFMSYLLNEPLRLALTIIFGVFAYIYFASQLVCQIFGLFLPIVYLHQKFYSAKNVQEMEPIYQYLVIYTHLEILSAIFNLFNLYFYHLKLLTIFILIYLVVYQEELLAILYDNLLFYDGQVVKWIIPYVTYVF